VEGVVWGVGVLVAGSVDQITGGLGVGADQIHTGRPSLHVETRQGGSEAPGKARRPAPRSPAAARAVVVAGDLCTLHCGSGSSATGMPKGAGGRTGRMCLDSCKRRGAVQRKTARQQGACKGLQLDALSLLLSLFFFLLLSLLHPPPFSLQQIRRPTPGLASVAIRPQSIERRPPRHLDRN
jgi:hypothetical protein